MKNITMIENLKGTLGGNVSAYYDIPYAKDGGRLQKALPADPITEVRDCTEPGVVFPQKSSGMEFMLGATEEEKNQSEDAFRLNVWTPDTNGNLPVLFFIPGGGWVSGGGSIPWYRGNKLAENQKMVVVTINYRLGALGNLYLPGIAEPNLAVLDIIMALQWVKENIAFFGGNPDDITISGQSAGAWYVLALLGCKQASGLFKKAILHSVPASIDVLSVEKAQELTETFLQECGLDMDSAGELIDLPVEKILEAQEGKQFLPFIDGDMIHGNLIESAIEVSGGKVDVVAGTTDTDIAPFLYNTPIRNLSEPIYKVLVPIFSKNMFIKPVHKLLKGMEQAGSEQHFYHFHVKTHLEREVLGSPHCFDLPFLFGNYVDWKDTPMLEGISEHKFMQISQQYQGCIGDFVHERPFADWMLHDEKYFSFEKPFNLGGFLRKGSFAPWGNKEKFRYAI